MQLSRILLATVMLGAAPIVSLQPAAAASMLAGHALDKGATNVEAAQFRHHGWRHHGGGWNHRGYRYGYGSRRSYYGGGYYGSGPAVLGGLAAGAIIGGAIANSQARAGNQEAYCSQRYKSYDPASGTYLGYDGARHPCP